MENLKEYLQFGNIAKLRCGDYGLITESGIVTEHWYISLQSYNDKLLFKTNEMSNMDITNIYHIKEKEQTFVRSHRNFNPVILEGFDKIWLQCVIGLIKKHSFHIEIIYSRSGIINIF